MQDAVMTRRLLGLDDRRQRRAVQRDRYQEVPGQFRDGGVSAMTDLLTRAEYAAIAGDLSFPSAPFIDGKFRKGRGATMPTMK